MENKINIAELLKDCPRGMELDCTIWGWDDIEFIHINTKDKDYPIVCIVKYPTGNYSICAFTKYGYYSISDSKCVIFPKGKTTWEGFIPPIKFKDGDVVISTSNNIHLISCRDKYNGGWESCCGIIHGKFDSTKTAHVIPARFATEEEKQLLFDTIKEHGYKWNSYTKTLEELPMFKVGDRIKHKSSGLYCTLGKYSEGISAYYTNIGLSITSTDLEHWELVPYKPYFKIGDNIRHKKNTTIIKTIGHIYSDSYALYDGHLLYFKEQDEWELIPNKFNINTLKTFDKVLVRCGNNGSWNPQFFSRYRPDSTFPFECTYNSWAQCIPYKGNEHLSVTTNDCNDYYKTWKE